MMCCQFFASQVDSMRLINDALKVERSIEHENESAAIAESDGNDWLSVEPFVDKMPAGDLTKQRTAVAIALAKSPRAVLFEGCVSSNHHQWLTEYLNSTEVKSSTEK